MKKTILFLMLIISTQTFALSFGQKNLYKINVIVFTHITKDALLSEDWPNGLFTPNLKNTVILGQYDNQNPDHNIFTQLPGSKLGLNWERHLLQKKTDYKIIAHLSWVQPINSFRYTKWVHIHAGQAYDEKGNVIEQNDSSVSVVLPAYWELNGLVKVSRSRFFDIYTRLYLTLPASLISGSDNVDASGDFRPIPLRTFTMIQHRRSRSKELNYFDHPLFGVLVQIMPLKNQSNV